MRSRFLARAARISAVSPKQQTRSHCDTSLPSSAPPTVTTQLNVQNDLPVFDVRSSGSWPSTAQNAVSMPRMAIAFRWSFVGLHGLGGFLPELLHFIRPAHQLGHPFGVARPHCERYGELDVRQSVLREKELHAVW